MTKQLLLLASLLLAATAAMAQTQTASRVVPARQSELNKWETYKIRGEEVTASFPIHPAMTTYGRYREVQRQRLTDRMVGAYADGVVYSVYTFDNPEPRDSFDEFIAREAPTGGWDNSSARSVTLGRYTGKEYSSKQSENPWTLQLFAIENRFYKFGATGAPSDDPAVKQFFSSIALDRKGGIEVSDGPGYGYSSQPKLPVVSGGVGLGPGTANPDAASKIFIGRDVDRKARLVMKPEPAYTEDARKAAIEGTVILKVVFSSSGNVTNIRISQELPYGLTEQAIAAARKIKYIPAIKDGKYVSMWMQLEYNFNLY